MLFYCPHVDMVASNHPSLSAKVEEPLGRFISGYAQMEAGCQIGKAGDPFVSHPEDP